MFKLNHLIPIILVQLPLDIWSQIFSYITDMKDIEFILLICKDFNILIRQNVNIIESNGGLPGVNHSSLIKFPNLSECHPKIKEIIPEKITTILSLKRFSVELYDMRKDWLSYWLDPKRTQEEFNSVSQSFTLAYPIPPCNNFSITQHLSCENGYLKIGYYDTAWSKLILPLTQKYYIILDVQYLRDWNYINTKFRSKALKVRQWDPFNNPFMFLSKNPHINYLEIEGFEAKGFIPNLVAEAQLNHYNFDQREITMKFPLHIN